MEWNNRKMDLGQESEDKVKDTKKKQTNPEYSTFHKTSGLFISKSHCPMRFQEGDGSNGALFLSLPKSLHKNIQQLEYLQQNQFAREWE